MYLDVWGLADHNHHQMVLLVSLVREVGGDAAQEPCGELAGWEGVEHPALLGGLVAQADHARRVLNMTAVTACMAA